MKFPKLKQGDLIEVKWNDSCTPESKGWISEANHEDIIMPVKTAAYFWKKTRKYLYTYSCMSTNPEYITQITNPFHIPLSCITSIERK